MTKNSELIKQGEGDSGQGGSIRSSYPPTPAFTRMASVPEEIFAVVLWRIIMRYKWTIAAFALVAVALVVTASFFMKPKYEAVGRIVVVFHRASDSGQLGFKGIDTSLLEDAEDVGAIETQIGILQTDALALQVIRDLQLDANPRFTGDAKQPVNQDILVKSFHSNLKVSRVKGTRLIEIRFRSTDPQLSADVVNSLSKQYVDQYYRSQFQVSQQISDYLAGQLTELGAKVEESQHKLIDYEKANGLFGLDDKQNIATAKLDDLNKELTAAESDRVQKEVNYRLARSGKPELLAKLEPDNLLTKLRSQQADLENQYAQASVALGPANPKIIELSKQLDSVRKSIDAEVKRIGERTAYEFQSAIGRERMLEGALGSQKLVADRLYASAVQSDILKHEFETNRKLYEDLLEKQKEVGVSAGLKSSNIWIVDPARAPRLPAEPNIPRNTALALLFGGFGGVLLAFGMSKMTEKTITNLDQAQALTSLTALGVVPLLDAKNGNGTTRKLLGIGGRHDPALVTLLHPMSLAAESYKAVLTALLLSQPTAPTVIQVTSALPGEGKTTVSTNLAILLARLHRRVLLVDADLRRPRVHQALRLTSEHGLGTLLRGRCSFEEAVTGWAKLPNLTILPAGPVILPDDTELLVSRFKDLVDDWRVQFDHVIIDTPPVLPVNDAVRISVDMDSVVLVIRAGEITQDTFAHAQNSLVKVNARLMGFVLNGVQVDSSDFRYYHSYYGPTEPKRFTARA
jgi:capsular exopolysaccharide synthesis family protein